MIPLDLVAEIRRPSRRIAWAAAYSATRFNTGPGEDCLLDGRLLGSPAVHAPADLGVLTFDVLADHDHVQLVDAGQRRGDARKDAYGAQVDVLVELAADGDQQAHRVTSLGMSSAPTAPSRVASPVASCSIPSTGIIRPWRW